MGGLQGRAGPAIPPAESRMQCGPSFHPAVVSTRSINESKSTAEGTNTLETLKNTDIDSVSLVVKGYPWMSLLSRRDWPPRFPVCFFNI